MRRFLVILVLLASSLPSRAAPLGGNAGKVPARLGPDEAQAFAQSLVMTADQINRFHVRPVAHRSLLFAALAGLYEEVRLPVPAGLRAELEMAVQEPVVPMASDW